MSDWNFAFPGSIYRARVKQVNDDYTVLLEVDLGLSVSCTRAFPLYNLSLPSVTSHAPSEQHHAVACLARLKELLDDNREVYLVTRRVPEGLHGVLFIVQRNSFKNVGLELVEAGLAAWQDPEQEPETLEG